MYSKCKGKLIFDEDSEVQWGAGWKEKLKCEVCRYQSKEYKLYEEVPWPGGGVKAAAPTVGLMIGLKTTPMGYKGLRQIFLSANIPPPALKTLQLNANKVGEAVVKLNSQHMEEERRQLQRNSSMAAGKVDSSTPVGIRAEGDGRYNNPLFGAIGRTPFQPATQATYTVCENMTESKKIIALNIDNKLCKSKHIHTPDVNSKLQIALQT